MEWFCAWEQKRADFRGCRPGASCQPASGTPRCWAWRPSVCTTPGDRSGRRPGQQTERQPRGKGSWNSPDLPGGRRGGQGGGYTWNKVNNVWRQKKCCTHHSACGGRTRHPVHPSPEWEAGSWWRDRPCFQTSPDPDRCFCQPQPQKLWVRHHLRRKNTAKQYKQVLYSHTYFQRLTFIFGFDAKRLIWAFVRRGDSQGAGNPKGAAGLSDFFTVGHVGGGSHQDDNPASGLTLQQQLKQMI